MFVQACHLLILVLVRHLTRTSLYTFLLVLMFATHLTVENQASGLQLRALPVGLPFPQELDLNLNNWGYRLVLAHGYSCILCVSCNMITRIIIEKKKKLPIVDSFYITLTLKIKQSLSIILVLFLAKTWHLLFSNYSRIICQGLKLCWEKELQLVSKLSKSRDPTTMGNWSGHPAPNFRRARELV